MRFPRYLAELTAVWVETDDFIPAEPAPGWSIVHEAANGRFFTTQRGNGWLRCMVTLDHFPHPDIPDKSERWLQASSEEGGEAK